MPASPFTAPSCIDRAKDDNHAEEIVGMVREVFGRGNEFARCTIEHNEIPLEQGVEHDRRRQK